MAWNPYTDQRNRAYQSIVTSLFPEQTKTLPRILVWSVIFLLDLILVVGGAFYLGWLEFGSKLVIVGILAVVVGLFWLQGFLWGALTKWYKKSRKLG